MAQNNVIRRHVLRSPDGQTVVLRRYGSIARTACAASVLLLSACSFTDEALWPSLTGEDPAGETATTVASAPQPTAQQQAASPILPTNQPTLGSGSFVPTGVTPGVNTGTFVGKKVQEMRGELQRLQTAIIEQNTALQGLRGKVVEDSQRYHGTVAAVNARLQVGTTPGNPILIQQFGSAQGDLDRLAGDIDSMNQLLNSVASGSTLSAYLNESVHAAYNVSGAVDEDHQQLAILEDEVNRTAVLVERLQKELSEDVRRQTSYVSTERSNLNLLAAGIQTGEIYGASLMNAALAGAGGGRAGPTAGTPADIGGRRPLVVIRFDRTKVPYEQALYNAVSKVLEGRPNATFDLVAVAPSTGGEAKIALNSTKSRRHAENVLRSLVEMGLPPTRVAVSGRTLTSASTNEVHLYVR